MTCDNACADDPKALSLLVLAEPVGDEVVDGLEAARGLRALGGDRDGGARAAASIIRPMMEVPPTVLPSAGRP